MVAMDIRCTLCDTIILRAEEVQEASIYVGVVCPKCVRSDQHEKRKLRIHGVDASATRDATSGLSPVEKAEEKRKRLLKRMWTQDCKNCGAKGVPMESEFCPNCGKPL